MLGKQMTVELGSDIYKKARSLEDLLMLQSLYIKMTESIMLINQEGLMGGRDSEFELTLIKLREQARDELNRASNRIMGIDEDIEIIISSVKEFG